MEILLIFFICFLASVVQGATGFGYAIITMTLLPFFMPFKTVVVIVLLLSIGLAAQLAWKMRGHIHMKFMVLPVFASMAGNWLGVILLQRLDTAVMKTILGLLLIGLAVYSTFVNHMQIKATPQNSIMIGLISGVLAGMLNIGVLLVIYYLSVFSDKRQYLATLQATFVVSSLITVGLHILYGNMDRSVLEIMPVGIAATLAGSFCGVWIFHRLSPTVLKKIVYSFMGIMGIMLLGTKK